MQPIRRLAMLAAVAVAALALLACGGNDDADSADGAPDDAETATVTATEEAATEDPGSDEPTVEFTLTEFAIDGPATAAAGTIRFDVKNEGTQIHELVIVRSDADLDALPVVDSVVSEAEVDVIGEVEEFPGGEERSATFNLEAGRYLLICNIPAHYQLGMVFEFIVE